MTPQRRPNAEEPLGDDGLGATPWDDARSRLAEPEPGRHNWLATVRPDGRPHLMPILVFWMEGALHFLTGEGTQKARNLATDGRCVIGTESRGLPSLDIVVIAPVDTGIVYQAGPPASQGTHVDITDTRSGAADAGRHQHSAPPASVGGPRRPRR